MDRQRDTGVEAILEHLIEHGANDVSTVFARAFELAMRIERERFLGAGHYERTANRQGWHPERLEKMDHAAAKLEFDTVPALDLF